MVSQISAQVKCCFPFKKYDFTKNFNSIWIHSPDKMWDYKVLFQIHLEYRPASFELFKLLFHTFFTLVKIAAFPGL